MADGSAPLVHTDFGMVLSSFHPTKVFTAFLVAASTENLPEESAWTYLPPISYTMARSRDGRHVGQGVRLRRVVQLRGVAVVGDVDELDGDAGFLLVLGHHLLPARV